MTDEREGGGGFIRVCDEEEQWMVAGWMGRAGTNTNLSARFAKADVS